MSNETAIQTRDEAQFSVAPPVEFDGPSGFENVDGDCTIIPFLKIAQSATPESKRGDPKQINGLEVGYFFCPATRKVYGETVQLILLKFYRQFVIYESRDAASKFMGLMSPEDFSKIEKRCTRERSYYLDEEGHRYVDTRNFIVLLADHLSDGPMLLSMSSTGIGPSRKLLTQATNVRADDGRQAPIWSSVWKLTTGYQSNDAGQSYYQVTAIDRLGYVRKDSAQIIVNAFLDAQGASSEVLADSFAKQHDEEPVKAADATHVTTPRQKAEASDDAPQMF